MQEAPEQSGYERVRSVPATESPWSLLFGAVIFGYAGFMFAWSTHPAAQTAMWSLRGLAIGFAIALALGLLAPRIGGYVRLLVVGVAAILLCGSGAWMLAVTSARDLFAWLLIIMGLFDAAEVSRWLAQRRAVAAYSDEGGP